MNITLPHVLTSESLIHDSTVICDLDFTLHNKNQILNRIQYWKEYFSKQNIKNIILMDSLNLNSIAIMFACFENSITIHTIHAFPDSSEDRAELIILGRVHYKVALDTPKYLKINNYGEVVDYTASDYTPCHINLDHVWVSARMPGYIEDENIKHTSKTIIYSSIASIPFHKEKQGFAGIAQLNHIGIIGPFVLGPVLAGATIHSATTFADLMFLADRGVLGLMALWGDQINSMRDFSEEYYSKFKNYKFDLRRCAIATAGRSPSYSALQWVLNSHGTKLISYYSNHRYITPLFKLDIESYDFDFYSRDLGQLMDGIEYKIDDDNYILVKNVTNSPFIECDSDGWIKVGDLAVEESGKVYFKGTTKIKNCFQADIENTIHLLLEDQTVGFGDFAIRYDEITDTLSVLVFNDKMYDKMSFIKDAIHAKLTMFINQQNSINLGLHNVCIELARPGVVKTRQPKG